jgi:mRNA-degrading endonuclease toxin of MazEF toxin-antitoxin module
MKPFEIYYWQPPDWNEAHPCVVVSHPDRADRKDPVEVVMCSTKRATRAAEKHEIILDQADGLDWPTICKCDVIHAVPRVNLKSRKGMITEARKAPLVRTIIAAHNWASVL